MTLYALGDKRPVLPETGRFYVAPGAQVIGDVRIGTDVTIWFNAVLRGDNDTITLGEGSNIQDGCIAHVDPGFPLTLGRDVTVGHGAILHGCDIGDGALIGMGACVLNGARIGRGALIGAKALVTEGKEIPDYAMVLGAPGKVVKTLTPEEAAALNRAAAHYRAKRDLYRAGLTPL